jgi:multidrug efflux system outer membrane protein
MSRASTAAVLLLAGLVSGCAVRGPYRPPVSAPAVLTTTGSPLVVEQRYDPRWWRQFQDPVLEQLEDLAVAANLDIRQAVARVDEARAIFDDVALDRWPTAVVGGDVDVREQAVPGLSDRPLRTTTYRAGVAPFWELDLFGGVRSSIRAAAATAQSFDASLEDMHVVVAADVARSYFDLRGLQHQLTVAERSLVNRSETLRLARARRGAGSGEELDVASAAASVAAVEASLPPIRAGIAVQAHRLAVLTGVRPGELAVDLAPRAYPVLVTVLPIGDAGALLRRRPDVRAAERRLAAAAAREGVAAADLFPRITLSGFIGLIAGRGNLFGRSDSRAWAVTPALSWAGFDLGSARARLRGAAAATRETLAAYEQAVLRAIEETENALVSYREEQARLERLMEQARESARAADLARIRYREGLSDFLALLDAERTQLAAEDGVARAEAAVLTGAVSVYEALGGAEPE